MPAITTNDLKNGITLELDNGLFQVVEFQHVKPGKGGAFVRTKLRNVKNGNVFDRTFNAGVRVEQALLEKKDMQFLYRDGNEYVFMDTENYDQLHVAPVALGDAANYMVEQAIAIIAFYQGEIVSVEIPASVELTITDTEPGMQGDRVSAPASRRHSRPVSLCRCRCSSTPVTGSGSIRAAATTSPESEVTRRRVRPADDERSDSRERAMMLLYEADSKGISASDVLGCADLRHRRADNVARRGRRADIRANSTRRSRHVRKGLDAGADADDRPHGSSDCRVRAARPIRRAGCGGAQRGGGVGQAVLDRRFRSLRQRCAVGAGPGAAAECLTSAVRFDTYHRDVISRGRRRLHDGDRRRRDR